jgi:hypothetical protein
MIDGVSVGDFTILNGATNSMTFEICSVSSVEMIWTPGDWETEVSFNLIDPLGTVLYSHVAGTPPTIGTFYSFTASCPVAENNTTVISGLSSGNYDLIISDGLGCAASETYTVLNNESTLEFTNIFIQDDNCNQGSGQIQMTVFGGTALTYLIDGGPGVGFPGTFFNVSSGIHVVTVTDGNGCSLDSTVVVGNQSTFVSTTTSSDEVCGLSDGAIDIEVAGAGTNFTYSWITGETSQDLNNLSAGTYVCTIIDTDNFCEDEVTVVITNLSDILVTSTFTNESCGDQTGSIDLTATGSTAITYTWSTGESTQNLTGLAAGDYECTVANTLTGCFEVESVSITNITSGLTASEIIGNDFCNNGTGSIDLNVTGGSGIYSYIWSNGEAVQNLFNLNAGIYTVTITDNLDGCQFMNTYEVLNNSQFTTDILSVANESCGNSEGAIDIDVQGFGTYTYDWSNGAVTQDLNGLSLGVYECTINDGFGCLDIISVEIENTSDLTVLTAFTNENCSDGTGAIDLTVTGSTDLSYDWSNGEITEDLADISAGIYTCMITNNTSSCIGNVTVEVLNITTGFNVVGGIINEDCGDGTGAINLATSGGSGTYIYAWSNSETTEDLTGLSAGTYDLTVTDEADGCSIIQSYMISNNATFNLTAALTESTCPTCVDGAINITIVETGLPDGPYTYTWSNGAISADLTGLTEGIYTVTATSASGCSLTREFVLINNNSTVGVVENDKLTLSVYPNPTTNKVFVDYELVADNTITLRIISLEGKTVYANLITNSDGLLEINTSHLNDGIYFVTVQSETISKTVKLVIAR